MANSVDPDQTAPVQSGTALFAQACLSENLGSLRYEPRHEKTCFAYAHNKGADQPAHLRSLISTFVVRCLGSIKPVFSISKILSLYLASVAARAGVRLAWSQTPKTCFLFTRLIYRNDPKFSDRQYWANSADPDQSAPRGRAVWSGSTLFAIPSASFGLITLW